MAATTTTLLLLSVPLLIFCAADELGITIQTPQGRVNGQRRLVDYDLPGALPVLEIFRGIPFAEPPVGKGRFKRATPFKEKPSLVINEGKEDVVCSQGQHWFLTVVKSERVPQYSEDCLYLSVYSPFDTYSPDAVYPVLVYFHGGSYQVGGRIYYDGSVLASSRLVVVVVNYRLGPFGFLGNGKDYPGNNGIHDQILALKWIQSNIVNYRGDPANVVIMGHSAGAWSVGVHMLSPLSKNLFHGAVIRSGSILSKLAWQTRESLEMTFEGFKSVMECGSGLQCLHNATTADILDIAGFIPSVPWIDGELLGDTPENLLENGKVNTVPVVLGTTEDEWARFLTIMNGSVPDKWLIVDDPDLQSPSNVKELIYEAVVMGMEKRNPNKYMETLIRLVLFEYTNFNKAPDSLENRELFFQIFADMFTVAPTERLAAHLTQAGATVYLYKFMETLPVNAEGVQQYSWLSDYSYHEVDIPFTFGAPLSGEIMVSAWFQGNYTDQHRAASKTQVGLLSSFCHSGAPLAQEIVDHFWPAYTVEDKSYALITKGNILQRKHQRPKRMYFWNELYPNLEEAAEGVPEPLAPEKLAGDLVQAWILYICIGAVAILMIVVLLLSMVAVRKRRTDPA